MKTFLTLLIGLVAFLAQAQTYQTIVVSAFAGATNIVVQTNEVVQIVEMGKTPSISDVRFSVRYPEVEAYRIYMGSRVLGPCDLGIQVFESAPSGGKAVILLCSTPNGSPFNVQKTVVQPAGFPVRVVMESSTNLTTWAETAPGDFPASDSHRFFRLSLTR